MKLDLSVVDCLAIETFRSRNERRQSHSNKLGTTSIIDAIIGFSIVYKAFENIGGFERLGIAIDPRLAVMVFGLFHGFGLATKLQALGLSEEGLLANLLAFNLGVELGQLLALVAIITLVNLWRAGARFQTQAVVANGLIMTAGYLFMFYQITGYLLEPMTS